MSKDKLQELENKYDPIPGSLVGVDGNAFAIMGFFKKEARKDGWDQEDISTVIDSAMSGDYNHLLATIQRFF